MYCCLCQNCDEGTLIEELDHAEEYFDDHANRGCEVEIINVEVAIDLLRGSTGPSVSPRDFQTTNEQSSGYETEPSETEIIGFCRRLKIKFGWP
ncbi:hypothetical protein HUG10_19845 (plasmid) [Halorarum halophilum]|uniref:Uncharacterized protein n=1 Tax=Halorarum halophilum TaxID=2743090 RepID=A0A7D5GEJ8_9EURY|nr:hypothetical protein [Halobaculum halophilum]QLG29865.1 hypothetical protein HUG10_19845 [Halobaculum halophilum]